MPTRHFTYTPPSDIEGEPAEVVEAAKHQIMRLAAVVARLAGETAIQLRSAGIDPDADDAVALWADTDDGRAAADLLWGAGAFGEVAKQL